ncbi:hypothetical protein HLB23_11515 [Nocardia uniformis]|uniref:Subtilisin inhibitor domain-containing protein n=1 Tax=Nocardia uniformis TaxID=53432 RepID=A0A849BV67_9NOCA|nr:subtilase-type protease inhibitor [Nocardia uniformis]NNH70483.1 hypothetical protein [Nocardia uniformis]
MRILFPVCALVAVAAVVGSGCASSESGRVSELTLSVTTPEDPDVARTVTLRCSPDIGGDHPAASQACAELTAVDGEFDELDVDPGAICTQHYDPVGYTVAGNWRGRAVTYTETFPNDCHGKAATGSVFDF